MPYRNLDVLDAAEQAVAMVNELIDRSPRGRLLYVQQLRNAVQSIAANLSEAFGRRRGRDRDHRLEIARAETEEALQHLKANFQRNRIGAKDYWPRHNRLVTIVKMVNALLNG